MWRSHPFSQRNSATKRAVGVNVEVFLGGRQNLKMMGWGGVGVGVGWEAKQYRNLHKLGGVMNPPQLCINFVTV